MSLLSITFPFEKPPAPGTTTEIAPGVRWLRMPLPLALNHINLYLIDAGDSWTIVDTGMRGKTTQEYWDTIFANELGGKPVTSIICTHMHPDHIGQAGWLSEKWRAPLYMTFGEYYTARTYSSMSEDKASLWPIEEYWTSTGMPALEIDELRKYAVGFGALVEPMPRSFRRLQDGDELRIGEHEWRIIVGYGHSPEHACLYSADLGVLLSGDQVIARISSNVGVSASDPFANPVQAWLESLNKLMRLPEDTFICPAHNLPFRGLHVRLHQLAAHHDTQLRKISEACIHEDKTAYSLLPVMFRPGLEGDQMMMAMGECVAHLNLLVERKQVERTLKDGVYCYRSRLAEFDDVVGSLHE